MSGAAVSTRGRGTGRDWRLWVMETAQATRLQSWYLRGKHYVSLAPHPRRHREAEETGLPLFWEGPPSGRRGTV